LASFQIRHASKEDFKVIRSLVRNARLNPTSLDWRRFLVAVSSDEAVVACGQVKFHSGGIREIASIVVAPEFRGLGIARSIIENLISNHEKPLYLMCRSSLEGFYMHFGFHALSREAMPTYFRRISTLAGMFFRFRPGGETLLIMKHD
jgi:amino-acid N-acetyltransferase